MILTIETLKRNIIEVILESNLEDLQKKADNVRKQIDFLDNIVKGSNNVDKSLRSLSKRAQSAENEQELKKIGDALQTLRLPQVEKGPSYEDLVSKGLISVGNEVEGEFNEQVQQIYSTIQDKQDEFNKESGQTSLFESKSSHADLVYCKITAKGKRHYNKLKKRYKELLQTIEDEAQGSLFEQKKEKGK
jgi:hypothetical protein